MDTTSTESVRSAYEPRPWWVYLVLTAFFVSYGLGRDLNTAWGAVGQFVSWVVLVGAAWAQWRRRQSKPAVASAWRDYDAVVWIVTIGFTAVTLAVLFGGPHVVASLGVPLPHAISGLLVGMLLVAAIPLGPWSAKRAAARGQSRQ